MSTGYIAVGIEHTTVTDGRGRRRLRMDRVRITRVSDAAVMYEGPCQGPYRPSRPGSSSVSTSHPDWEAMDFAERDRIVVAIGADPVRRPPREPMAVAPGRELVGEFVGRRLVIRERKL